MRIRKRQIALLVSLFIAGFSWLTVRLIPVSERQNTVSSVASNAPSESDLASPAIDSDQDSMIDPLVEEGENDADAADANPGIETNAAILHVVDGDTFDADLDGVGKVRIRMLGVNTPETVDPRKTVECFGKEASNFSKKTLAVGNRIRLESDPQADERDKYGRLLRNVVLADGTDYNVLLIQKGYAYAYLSFPLNPKRKTELKKLELAAKEAGEGLWGSECH